MPSLEAIIFDVDGTLADTEETHRLAFNQAFIEFKLDWHWSRREYTQLLAVSGGKERILLRLQQDNTAADKDKDLRQLAEVIHRRKSQIYRQRLTDGHVSLRPGVERLINEARLEKIKLAVATSSSRKNLDTLLRNNLGLDAAALFSSIVTCDIVEEKKPSPAVYRYAMAELGVEPSSCIAIEDTHNGNLAALAAGVCTIITTHAFTIDNDFTGASLVIDNLGDPGQPFIVAAGSAHGADYVDINLLRTIQAQKKSPDPDLSIPSDLASITAK